MTVSKTCTVIATCDTYENTGKCDGCNTLAEELRNRITLVDGGWYQARNRSIHQVHKQLVPLQIQKWLGTGGLEFCDDGRFFIEHNRMSEHDLLKRVNPPTDYVAVKKWLWMREITLPDGVACKLVTKERSEIKPEGEWYEEPDSEIEE